MPSITHDQAEALANLNREAFQALIDGARLAMTCGHTPAARSWAKAHGCQLPHCGAPDCRACSGKYQPLPQPVFINILGPRFAAMDWAQPGETE